MINAADDPGLKNPELGEKGEGQRGDDGIGACQGKNGGVRGRKEKSGVLLPIQLGNPEAGRQKIRSHGACSRREGSGWSKRLQTL